MKILKKIKDVLSFPEGFEKFFQLYFETYNPAGILSTSYPSIATDLTRFQEILYDDIGMTPLATGYFEHSNEKYISKFFDSIIKDWDGEDWSYFESRVMVYIASQLTNRYFLNWFKLWKSYYDTEYNPLENYRMEEVRTPNLTEVSSGSDSLTSTTKTKTDLTQSGSNNSKTGLFAFNSSGDNSVPTNDGEVESSVRTTGSENDNYSLTTQGKTDSSTKTNTGTERLERSGNIGVTTSQQMLQSELELRKFDLLNRIFDDIDKVLCLKIY